MRLSLRVPATTANMGPGFDCIGMALALYNHTRVETDGVTSPLTIRAGEGVPSDESNLIYRTIRGFCAEVGAAVPAMTITQDDNIPMTRGLGSSAACVVAGLLAGNELSNAGLSHAELIRMAARLEGHPDNSTPALAGGLCVGVMQNGGLDYIRVGGAWSERLRFALMVPGFTLKTEDARAALPDAYSRADAVFNASRTALLVAALMSGDFEKLGSAFEDRFHQPYRSGLVPGMEDIIKESRERGAYGAFLSGAGPAVIAVTEDEGFLSRMAGFLADTDWEIRWVEPDMDGAYVKVSAE
jgi:homoserine kinase